MKIQFISHARNERDTAAKSEYVPVPLRPVILPIISVGGGVRKCTTPKWWDLWTCSKQTKYTYE